MSRPLLAVPGCCNEEPHLPAPFPRNTFGRRFVGRGEDRTPTGSGQSGSPRAGIKEDIVKREIWATITFLVTGLLFYLAQTSPPSASHLSQGDSALEDTVMVVTQATRGA